MKDHQKYFEHNGNTFEIGVTNLIQLSGTDFDLIWGDGLYEYERAYDHTRGQDHEVDLQYLPEFVRENIEKFVIYGNDGEPMDRDTYFETLQDLFALHVEADNKPAEWELECRIVRFITGTRAVDLSPKESREPDMNSDHKSDELFQRLSAMRLK